MLIEVCANGLESALRAQSAGADRIELCSELSVGGLTPSAGCLRVVLDELHIPVHVLIRPRSGPFTYNALEWKQMEAEMDAALEAGAHGIVWGGLTPDFGLDTKGLERVLKRVEQSNPKPFLTFHRAIDWAINRNNSLKELTHYPIDCILSSGGSPSAGDALDQLMMEQKMFKTTVLMPGGGVHSGNISRFKQAGFQAIHFSGTAFEDRGIEKGLIPKVSFNQKDLVEEFRVRVSSDERLQEVFQIVKSD